MSRKLGLHVCLSERMQKKIVSSAAEIGFFFTAHPTLTLALLIKRSWISLSFQVEVFVCIISFSRDICIFVFFHFCVRCALETSSTSPIACCEFCILPWAHLHIFLGVWQEKVRNNWLWHLRSHVQPLWKITEKMFGLHLKSESSLSDFQELGWETHPPWNRGRESGVENIIELDSVSAGFGCQCLGLPQANLPCW